MSFVSYFVRGNVSIVSVVVIVRGYDCGGMV